MSKLLGNQTIEGYVPKMIELRHGYIINGQYCNGEDMQVSPFNSVYHGYMTDTSKVKLSLNQDICWTDTTQTTGGGHASNILFDKFDAEVCYVAMKSNNLYTMMIFKFRESKGKCTIEGVYKTNVGSSNYVDLVELSQFNENTILFVNNRVISAREGLYFNWINTKNMTQTKETDISEMYCLRASKVDENFFIAEGYNSYNFFRVKENMTVQHEKVSKPLSVSTNGASTFINVFTTKTDDANTYVFYGHSTDLTNVFKKVLKLTATYNKLDDSMKIAQEEVTIAVPEKVDIPFRMNHINYAVTLQGATKKYWINFFSDGSNPRTMPMVIFEILEDGNLKYLKHKTIANNVAKSILFKNGGKRVLIPSYSDGVITRIAICDWDDVTEDYVVTKTIDESIHAFGYNKNDELIVMYGDTSIDKFNDTDVATFSAVFDEEVYRYEGEIIQTNLTTNVLSLEGVRLAKKVKLVLEGAAIFTSTSNKTYEFTSSATLDTVIPITINGPGAINIYPKIEA